jgi:hypothetical protein
MIFSGDAPELEASLDRAFHHRRVNRINERKEFFRVNLSEIKKVVHQNHKNKSQAPSNFLDGACDLFIQ